MFLVGTLRRSRLGPINRNIVTIRSALPRLSPRIVNLRAPCLKRFETTSIKTKTKTDITPRASEKAASQKFAYPERLCIYHAGTTRITFLACLKVTTLFIFIYFGFVVTPHYLAQEGPSLTAACTALAAIVPLMFVSWTTSPFVAFISIRLPRLARQSEDMLRRFVEKSAAEAELEITTINLMAKPRLSRVNTSDLMPVKRRLGIVNLARDTKAENAARKWYMPRAVGNFSVQTNSMPRVPWVWEKTSKTVERRRE
ncbi:hypothetical protein F5X99DRAFT_86142 [Biscogniauxia marginata]|nr:hypothetical protein F5X99DRAFT_86142 [Biscogniauxia marginata]